jgi:ribosomal protein S17E
MGKYEWIEMSDAKEIANILIGKYPDQFGHISQQEKSS